jgi:hypothetical protein
MSADRARQTPSNHPPVGRVLLIKKSAEKLRKAASAALPQAAST